MLTQLADGQFNRIAIIEIGIGLAGEDVELAVSRLRHRRNAGIAIAIIGCGVRHSQAVLQQLNVQIAVTGGFVRLIPDPHQIPSASGIQIPVVVVGFNHDGYRRGQLFLGKGRSLFAIFLNFAGAFGGVDSQVARLEHAAGHQRLRHGKVGGVAVHIGSHRDRLPQGCAGRAQMHGSGIVHPLRRRALGHGGRGRQGKQQHDQQQKTLS